MATIDETWSKWFQTKDTRYRQELVDYYYKYALRYIMQAASIFRDVLTDTDQLISNAGYEVLVAVDQYDPAKKIKFLSYLAKRIQWNVWNMMRDKDNLTEYERRLIKQYRRTKAGWKKNVEPTDEAICAKIGIPVQEFRQIQARDLLKDVPLNALPDNRIDDIMIGVATRCYIPTPSDIVERRDMVEKILSYLDEVSRVIFILRYVYSMTSREISKYIGDISPAAVEAVLRRQKIRIREYFIRDGSSPPPDRQIFKSATEM